MKLFHLLFYWTLWYLAFSSRTILSPLLPLIEDALELRHATAGSLFLFLAVGRTLAVAAAGMVVLRIGYKYLIFASFCLMTVSMAGLTYAQGYAVLAVLLFFLGASSGFYLPCAVPMITATFERKDWGKALSFHETAAGFSFLSIPFVIAFLLDRIAWRSIFILYAAIILTTALLFLALTPNPTPRKKKQLSRKAIFRRSEFWIILTLWVACGISGMGVYNIIPLYLVNEKAMALEQANRLFSLSRIGGFVGQISIAFFLDRCSTKKIIYFLMGAGGLCTIGLALVQSHWLLTTMLFLQATFCVVFFPVGLVAISKLTAPEERSLFTGTIMAISGVLSIGMTPFVLGAIADAFSFQAGLFLVGVVTLCACLPLGWLRTIQ